MCVEAAGLTTGILLAIQKQLSLVIFEFDSLGLLLGALQDDTRIPCSLVDE